MKCPRCQQENRPGAKFCEAWAAPPALRCANRGTQISVELNRTALEMARAFVPKKFSDATTVYQG
jgi:hypothetical protein